MRPITLRVPDAGNNRHELTDSLDRNYLKARSATRSIARAGFRIAPEIINELLCMAGET
ncbi:MAG: hypothetical protein LBV47_00575 [Bacteroidales bacterium]|jgi:hypothetical protein|nr:hypothetical protein [Bacteroidales bacterium]